MVFDICFYKYCSNRLSQYPTLDYAKDVIIESLKLTLPLNGKRQLSIIKRGDGDCIRLYQIYNHVYNKGNDSFGVCLVFYKNFPSDIEFLFDFYGLIISDIIKEGKAFHYNDDGEILSDYECLEVHDSSLKKYRMRIKNTLKGLKTGVKAIPQNVYSTYKYEHIICQLSDKLWSLDDVFVNNNIVIITEEVEDENILHVKNIIRGLNNKNKAKDKQLEQKDEQIESLKSQNTNKDKQIQELEEKLRKSKEANQKQSGSHGSGSFDRQKEIGTKKKTPNQSKPNPLVKPTKKKRDRDWVVDAIIGVFSLLILFSLIAPWFIPGLLPKLAVALTGVAVFLLILAFNDVFTKREYGVSYVCLSAIILSSLMTGYGLIWGFPSFNNGKHEQGTNVNVPEKTEKNAWREAKQINTIDAYKIFVESNGQSKYVEDALFKIVRFARANNNTLGLSYVINYEDSCRVNDCLPYDTTSTPGAEARDSVVSLCKIWVSSASNLKKRISKYSFDRDYSNEKEQEYLGKMVKDALALDSIWSLIDNEFNICDMQKNKCHYNVYEINGVIDSVFSSLIMAQEILTIGKSKLADGERYATDENKSFYKQAIKCVYKYFDERHYSGMEVINDCMLYEKSY